MAAHEFKLLNILFTFGLVIFFLENSKVVGFLSAGSGMFNGFALAARLKNTSTTPSSLTLKAYLFNYTNVDDYERGKVEKLNVEEVGPFVYTEIIEKHNVEYHDNGSVSYQDRRQHQFQADLSANLSERIITPNVAMLAVVQKLENANYFLKLTIAHVILALDAEPFLNLTAQRLIWGYENELLKLTKNASLHSGLPLGIFESRIGKSNDVMTTTTASETDKGFGLIDNINGESSLDLWSTDECNRIKGSPVSIFPIEDIKQKKPVHLYDKDICRKIPLVFKEEVLHENVLTYRYVIPDTIFDRPELSPENKCFCQTSDCSPQGTFNVTSCVNGGLTFLSFPHFHKADSELTEHISGLNSISENYQSYVDIHPSYGFAMAGKLRLQINIHVTKPSETFKIDMFKTDVMLPIAWFEVGLDEVILPNWMNDEHGTENCIRNEFDEVSSTSPLDEVSSTSPLDED